jgi:hypothetical protein
LCPEYIRVRYDPLIRFPSEFDFCYVFARSWNILRFKDGLLYHWARTVMYMASLLTQATNLVARISLSKGQLAGDSLFVGASSIAQVWAETLPVLA